MQYLVRTFEFGRSSSRHTGRGGELARNSFASTTASGATAAAEFDPEQRTWVEQTVRPFGETQVMDNVTLRVESEALNELPNEDEEELPRVMLFSSGEVTPFTLYLEPEWDAAAWEVSSDGLSRTQAERAEF
jgi:hypothetical protein